MSALDPGRWREVRRWVGELAELPQGAREERLAQLEPEVAAQVRTLLLADDPTLLGRLEAVVGRGAADWLAERESADELDGSGLERDLTGTRLGAWRVEGPLGRGGMAEVWEASRADGAYEQRVAVKLIKRGMDSEEIVARFRRERQILASLDHPAITGILDGGVAPDGRPYLVLEKVDGEPVTAWCARREVDVEHRLRLLVEVCDAVAAAHRRLVVHRDLKPSNILVDREGRVRLLDFGIAKLLAEDDPADATRTDVRVLTPAYAAPEQILGEPVSTATDVYALGVLAYELLTGRLPHRRESRRAGELAAEVSRESVARPSTAVLEAGEPPSPTLPDRRRLARRLRGDLDAILLTALRREPARRYASVDALGEDLRRSLDGRPVAARGDSLAYRTRRFVRRHRLGVAAVSLAALSLVGGLAAALWQADRAARAAAAAREEAAESEAIATFLTEVFTAADPEGAQAADRTARELVASGAERIAADLSLPPATRAAMLHVLGTVHYQLGLYEPARALLAEALATRRSLRPEPTADVATTAASLGALLHRQGDSAAGAALLEEAVALHERASGPESLEVARALNNLANAHKALGRPGEARATFERAIAILEREDGGDPAVLARVLNNYGLFLDRNGEDEAARPVLERALALHETTSGPDSALVVGTLGNLAMLHLALDDPEAALAAARRALATSVRAYGPEHFETGMAENTLGWTLLAAGRPAEARPALEKSVEHLEAALGGGHPTLAYSYRNLGEALAATGEPAAAIAALRRAAAIWEEASGPDDTRLVSVYRRLAPLLAEGGEGEEAQRLAERVVALRHDGTLQQRAEAWLELARVRRQLCRVAAAAEAVARARELAAGEPGVEWTAAVAEAERELATASCPPAS